MVNFQDKYLLLKGQWVWLHDLLQTTTRLGGTKRCTVTKPWSDCRLKIGKLRENIYQNMQCTNKSIFSVHAINILDCFTVSSANFRQKKIYNCNLRKFTKILAICLWTIVSEFGVPIKKRIKKWWLMTGYFVVLSYSLHSFLCLCDAFCLKFDVFF